MGNCTSLTNTTLTCGAEASLYCSSLQGTTVTLGDVSTKTLATTSTFVPTTTVFTTVYALPSDVASCTTSVAAKKREADRKSTTTLTTSSSSSKSKSKSKTKKKKKKTKTSTASPTTTTSSSSTKTKTSKSSTTSKTSTSSTSKTSKSSTTSKTSTSSTSKTSTSSTSKTSTSSTTSKTSTSSKTSSTSSHSSSSTSSSTSSHSSTSTTSSTPTTSTTKSKTKTKSSTITSAVPYPTCFAPNLSPYNQTQACIFCVGVGEVDYTAYSATSTSDVARVTTSETTSTHTFTSTITSTVSSFSIQAAVTGAGDDHYVYAYPASGGGSGAVVFDDPDNSPTEFGFGSDCSLQSGANSLLIFSGYVDNKETGSFPSSWLVDCRVDLDQGASGTFPLYCAPEYNDYCAISDSSVVYWWQSGSENETPGCSAITQLYAAAVTS